MEFVSEGSRFILYVNFDFELMFFLWEVYYLGGEFFLICFFDFVWVLLRLIDDSFLRFIVMRFEIIVIWYNFVMVNMKEFERFLFERKFVKIDEVNYVVVKNYLLEWRYIFFIFNDVKVKKIFCIKYIEIEKNSLFL